MKRLLVAGALLASVSTGAASAPTRHRVIFDTDFVMPRADDGQGELAVARAGGSYSHLREGFHDSKTLFLIVILLALSIPLTAGAHDSGPPRVRVADTFDGQLVTMQNRIDAWAPTPATWSRPSDTTAAGRPARSAPSPWSWPRP